MTDIAPAVRVGVDVGGTFTDVVTVRNGRLAVTKVSSTPAAPEDGVLAGLESSRETVGFEPEAVTSLAHGTTVATNAVLERDWADVALVTTAGFRDALAIGRQNRPDIYDPSVIKPEPIVPRQLRFEVDERLDDRGRIRRELDEDAVDAAGEAIREADVDSVAISLLFSFENDAHERAVADAIETAAPAVSLSLSSAVLPEIREYERTLATALDAALKPVMDDYLGRLEGAVDERGLSAGLSVMQSNGGVIGAGRARSRPVNTLLSGPAAGVQGAAYVAGLADETDLLTMDMGGTSCDVSLVRNGEPTVTDSLTVGDYPIRIPAVDVHTIGAGGGSIAWIDEGGALRVGSRSAGADPGPVCYGRGGTEPTVTDAQVCCGRLDPETFAVEGRTGWGDGTDDGEGTGDGEPTGDGKRTGGVEGTGDGEPTGDVERTIDERSDDPREQAVAAIVDHVADPLGVDVDEAAAGILDVANASMERALRVVSVERGHDPRDFTLVAFGGAGPAHATALADSLDVSRVLVPRTAGVLSALGLLASDRRIDRATSMVRRLDAVDPAAVEETFDRTEREAREGLGESADPGTVVARRALDCRYVGQSFDVTVDLPDDATGDVDRETLEAVAAQFHDAHEARYGHASPDEPVELVAVRVRVRRPVEPPTIAPPEATGDPADAILSERSVYFDEHWRETPVYDRNGLAVDATVEGPAIVEGHESTLVVRPNWTATVDPQGTIVLEVADER